MHTECKSGSPAVLAKLIFFSRAEFHMGSTITCLFSLCMQTPHQESVCLGRDHQDFWVSFCTVVKNSIMWALSLADQSPFWNSQHFFTPTILHGKTGIEPHILISSAHLCTTGLHPMVFKPVPSFSVNRLPSVYSHKQALQPSFPSFGQPSSVRHLSSFHLLWTENGSDLHEKFFLVVANALK